MKKYEIFGYTPDLPSIIIEAKNFDKALAMARQKNSKYCSGRAYDESVKLINPKIN